MLRSLSNDAAPSMHIVLPPSGGPQERIFQLVSRRSYSSVGFPSTTFRHFTAEAASNRMLRTRIVPPHARVCAQQLLGMDSLTRVLNLLFHTIAGHERN
ncbi:hypothetical protein AVEN_123794-1 [Araneus ventricosus]|uniref:Uncharacterized protein n=1 Tax=Araneus ventricosus TaxID=182803 RepID=A0A4Y2BK31_ARAVE|nr:hypothetical protein AVEN_123794-1 [Araneus ventricosus]